jgi:hypothetical protein
MLSLAYPLQLCCNTHNSFFLVTEYALVTCINQRVMAG